MSWRDIFFPENPRMREQLIRKSQELQVLMEHNFRATNQLIEILKKHLGLSLDSITLNEKATVKENCDVIIERIHQIQTEVEKIDKKLKEKLEPTLYEKLKSMSLSIPEQSKIAGIVHAVCSFANIASCSVVVGWLIINGAVLKSISLTFSVIGKGIFACVMLGLLFTGIDAAFQFILGRIERDQLKEALKEYDEALEKFRPVSYEYQDSITYVRIRLEMN